MNKKYLSISIIIFSCVIAGIIFGINYYIKQVLPLRWLTYQDNNIGITFKYPPDLETFNSGSGISLKSKDDSSVFSLVSINRYFGFGGQGMVSDVLKQVGHASSTQIINEGGKIGVLAFWPDSPNDKTLYILADDTLFDVELNNIDPNKFLKNLEFTKPQVLAEYKTISSKNYKTFVNKKQGYQIDIPINLGISIFSVRGGFGGSVLDDAGVFFNEPYYGPDPASGPAIQIIVASSTQESADIEAHNKNNTFEKNIVVDGAKAALTHLGNSSNSADVYPGAEMIYIFKDGMLYTIKVVNTDYTKVLEGFKFLKP